MPYKDSDSIVKVVERLIKNPNECRARGEKGKEIVKKYYNYQEYVNKHINLYKEILIRRNVLKGKFL